ncbi:citrate-binding protein-like [Miscanthus floridulus]|uniref:citrate-binding protein-like n=1 Tax=Miscanthus floridulus TaxID=154761 RepID=UPI003458B03B
MAPASSLPRPLLLFIVLVSWCGRSSAGVDSTLGFIAVNLTEDRFKLHHPYDLPPEQRYEFRDGVRRIWFRLNVVHDVGAGALTVFVDGEKRLAVAGHGGYRHYFKFRVYTHWDPSHYMDSRWRDVNVYTKLG